MDLPSFTLSISLIEIFGELCRFKPPEQNNAQRALDLTALKANSSAQQSMNKLKAHYSWPVTAATAAQCSFV